MAIVARVAMIGLTRPLVTSSPLTRPHSGADDDRSGDPYRRRIGAAMARAAATPATPTIEPTEMSIAPGDDDDGLRRGDQAEDRDGVQDVGEVARLKERLAAATEPKIATRIASAASRLRFCAPTASRARRHRQG